MAVNFTANIGLAKPTESEVAKNWVASTKLAEDNNIIIVAKTDIPVTQYTPAFIAATTNPNVGSGVGAIVVGEYQKISGIIMGSFHIKCIDPGVAPGTGVGAYGISLPELPDNSFHTVGTGLADTPGQLSCVGEGHMTDGDSVPNSGTVAYDLVTIGGVCYLRPITEFYAGKAARWFGPTFPFTLATSDGLVGSFIYKAATV